MALQDYKISKDQGFRMTLGGLTSSAAVLGILWIFVEPILVKSVSVAMAEDIDDAVQQQVEPLNNAFVALLQRDINKVRKDIAALRFKQRRGEDSAEDAQNLANLEIELESLQLAMKALTRGNS